MWHSSFDQTLSIDFGGVMGFAVRVWSWKLFQIKYPLVFGSDRPNFRFGRTSAELSDKE